MAQRDSEAQAAQATRLREEVDLLGKQVGSACGPFGHADLVHFVCWLVLGICRVYVPGLRVRVGVPWLLGAGASLGAGACAGATCQCRLSC